MAPANVPPPGTGGTGCCVSTGSAKTAGTGRPDAATVGDALTEHRRTAVQDGPRERSL